MLPQSFRPCAILHCSLTFVKQSNQPTLQIQSCTALLFHSLPSFNCSPGLDHRSGMDWHSPIPKPSTRPSGHRSRSAAPEARAARERPTWWRRMFRRICESPARHRFAQTWLAASLWALWRRSAAGAQAPRSEQSAQRGRPLRRCASGRFRCRRCRRRCVSRELCIGLVIAFWLC